MDYDVTSGANVVGDIHNIPLPDTSVDSIICHLARGARSSYSDGDIIVFFEENKCNERACPKKMKINLE